MFGDRLDVHGAKCGEGKIFRSLGRMPRSRYLNKVGSRGGTTGVEAGCKGNGSCGYSKEETQGGMWNVIWNVVGSNPTSTP